jgi:hypothetical protein
LGGRNKSLEKLHNEELHDLYSLLDIRMDDQMMDADGHDMQHALEKRNRYGV